MQDYYRVTTPEPHIGRMKEILKAYPEVKTLFGNTPSSFLMTVGVVSLQILVAALLANQPFWIILATSWLIGAVANHALFVMIHESCHNLIFKSASANRWAGMVANLPIVFPAAMGFRTYHLQHHRYQGQFNRDADLAGPREAKLIGNSAIKKVLWLASFFFIQGVIRPNRVKEIKLWDRWVALNVVVQLSFIAMLTSAFGWNAIIYLALSTLFSVGLHPVGARWIQEHYVIEGTHQETYSYYGPFNKFCFNVGYHNEHHDMMVIAWSRLPKLKAMAPEFYDTLYSHRSWSKLLWKFITTPEYNLYSRVTRPDRANYTQPVEAGSTPKDCQIAS